MLNQNRSDSAAVQCLLRMAAHQRSDVSSCGPLGAGPRCSVNLGCGRRQECLDERRGSDVYEVGTDNGTATTTTKSLVRVLTRRTYKRALLWLAQGGSRSAH